MTSPQERITDAVRRSQETVNSTVRTMTDGVQKLVSSIDLRTTVPTLEDLVDRSYAFAVQVLNVQRDFTKSLLAYAAPVNEDVPARATKSSTSAAAKKN
jgi:hypothetical protein